jgi:two-component system, NtrC family, sensor kinase
LKERTSIIRDPAEVEQVLERWAQQLPAYTILLYCLDPDQTSYRVAATYGCASGTPTSITLSTSLKTTLAQQQSAVVRGSLDHDDPLNEDLDQLGTDVCLPLLVQGTPIGFCAIGFQTSSYVPTPREVGLLETMASALALILKQKLLVCEPRRLLHRLPGAQRLHSLDSMAAGLAHEIRNPLTSIKTFLQLVPERKDDPNFLTSFSRVAFDEAARIERLIYEIVDYARYRDPQFMEQDLNALVSEVLYFFDVNAGQAHVRINKQLGEGIPRVKVDRQQIKQVLINLVLNALEAMAPRGGVLRAETRYVHALSGPCVQVEVGDTGCGIPTNDLDSIFDPFFTRKHDSEEREGTGLGLSIVRQIISDHGGSIEVSSQVGIGTTFVVTLPTGAPQGAGTHHGME